MRCLADHLSRHRRFDPTRCPDLVPGRPEHRCADRMNVPLSTVVLVHDDGGWTSSAATCRRTRRIHLIQGSTKVGRRPAAPVANTLLMTQRPHRTMVNRQLSVVHEAHRLNGPQSRFRTACPSVRKELGVGTCSAWHFAMQAGSFGGFYVCDAIDARSPFARSSSRAAP